MVEPLLQKFAAEVRPISRQAVWLVGLSGGADSTALLHFCLSVVEPKQICALHLNHSLRGEESDADEGFCRALCADVGVQFISEKQDVVAYALENKLNLEDAARQCRRSFFLRVAQNFSQALLLLAHHQDDQLETVLQRLMRGAGWRGLAGIPVQSCIPSIDPSMSIPLYRPLLGISRKEIIRWLTAQGYCWREDSSNQSMSYLRNRLRNGVMPALLTVFADLPQRLGAVADYAAQMDSDVAQAAELVVCHPQYGGWFIPFQEVEATYVIRRLEMCAAEYMPEINFNRRSYRQLEKMLLGEQAVLAVDLPGGLRVRRESDGYFLFDPRRYPLEFAGKDAANFPCCVDTAEWVLRCEEVELDGEVPERGNPQVEYIPREVIRGGVLLRQAQTGDRLAVAAGHKKLSDIFGETQTPLRVRENAPVVADAAGILWLPPLRVSARIFSAQAPFTGGFLRLEFKYK